MCGLAMGFAWFSPSSLLGAWWALHVTNRASALSWEAYTGLPLLDRHSPLAWASAVSAAVPPILGALYQWVALPLAASAGPF